MFRFAAACLACCLLAAAPAAAQSSQPADKVRKTMAPSIVGYRRMLTLDRVAHIPMSGFGVPEHRLDLYASNQDWMRNNFV